MLEIYIYSDYVCPYCYFAETELEKALEGLEEEAEVHWMPWELYPHPVGLPSAEELQREWRDKVAPVARQLGIPAIMPRVWPQPRTELALTGYQFALEKDLEKEYNARIFRAYYQQGLDIGDEEVLVELAVEAGLNANEFRQAIKSRKYRNAHKDALQHAYQEVEVRDVPTFIIGDDLYEGLFPHQELRKIIQQKLEQER